MNIKLYSDLMQATPPPPPIPEKTGIPFLLLRRIQFWDKLLEPALKMGSKQKHNPSPGRWIGRRKLYIDHDVNCNYLPPSPSRDRGGGARPSVFAIQLTVDTLKDYNHPRGLFRGFCLGGWVLRFRFISPPKRCFTFIRTPSKREARTWSRTKWKIYW